MTAVYRDVGRNGVPGVTFPILEIECDEPSIHLRDSDLRAPYRPLCGRITLNPSVTGWSDGSMLELAQVSLYISSPPRPGQNPQADTYQELGITDINLSVPPQKRRDPSYYAACVQFGSRMMLPNTQMTIVPFAIKLPMTLCSPGGTRTFTLITKAVFERGGAPRKSAPSHFEVSSNPIIFGITHSK